MKSSTRKRQIPLITSREIAIVDSLLSGATAREVAEELKVSFHTVRTHIRNVYAKLGVASRLELLKWRDGRFQTGESE